MCCLSYWHDSQGLAADGWPIVSLTTWIDVSWNTVFISPLLFFFFFFFWLGSYRNRIRAVLVLIGSHLSQWFGHVCVCVRAKACLRYCLLRRTPVPSTRAVLAGVFSVYQLFSGAPNLAPASWPGKRWTRCRSFKGVCRHALSFFFLLLPLLSHSTFLTWLGWSSPHTRRRWIKRRQKKKKKW